MTCLSSQVFASGFSLLEQNVTNLGTAYSGTAALAEDASTGYFNPAGLTRIVDSQIVLSGIVIQGDFKLEADAATASFGRAMGPGSAHPGKVVAVPTMHLAKRINDRWMFGFNVTTPFGLVTRYDEESIARYNATNSELITVDLSPSLAYQVLPCLSLGAGFDAMYANATLSARLGNGNALGETVLEGYQRNHANGWGYGFHMGMLWEPLDTTRVGLSYRSAVNLHAEGDSENLLPTLFAPPAGPNNQYIISKVQSRITVPETATVSLYHAFTPQIAILGDVAWTNWSRFTTLRLHFQNPLPLASQLNPSSSVIRDSDTAENFEDTWRFALGLTYTYDDCWLFRVGAALDQSPVKDEFRTARLPDSDRYWLTVGAAYTLTNNTRIDFGYAHIFFKDCSINETAPNVANTNTPLSAATLQGNYKDSANLVGIQIRYDFV